MTFKVERVLLRMFRYMRLDDAIEERHRYLLERLKHIDAPLGLKGMSDLKMPKFGQGPSAFSVYKHPDTPGVRQQYSYISRYEDYLNDFPLGMDTLFFEFKATYKKIDFHKIVYEQFPQVIEIYDPFDADSTYSRYSIAYENGTQPDESTGVYYPSGEEKSLIPAYNKLVDNGIIPNGDSNIYTLQPIVYWSNNYCLKALQYDRDEVIRRLEGRVLDIRRINDGVYIIFNDNPLLSFEDFLEINHTFKPLLGIE